MNQPLEPRRLAIAYCSLGMLGLILSEKPEEVTYGDGNKGVAWLGIQLRHLTLPGAMTHDGQDKILKPGDKWSSRTPRVIGYLDQMDILFAPVQSTPAEEASQFFHELLTGGRVIVGIDPANPGSQDSTQAYQIRDGVVSSVPEQPCCGDPGDCSKPCETKEGQPNV
jgi:hypothetical protein